MIPLQASMKAANGLITFNGANDGESEDDSYKTGER